MNGDEVHRVVRLARAETFRRDPEGSTPSRQRRASQPEASLAGVAATSLLKRRQQVLKPRVSLEMFLLLEPSLSFERGQHRRHRHGQGSSVRPGSWSGAEAQDGSPGNLRDPARVHARASRHLGSRLNKCPGPGRSSTDAGALIGEHEQRRDRVVPGSEPISDRECVSGKS